MDEVKHHLKEARDALNNKDFENAIKHSKSVLKKDKNNYMALIMLGVALQDSDQAPFAFKRAISLNSNKILAWQGLEKFYEKVESIDSWKELVDIYAKLLYAEEDLSKWTEICSKLAKLAYKLDDTAKCGKILYDCYLQANAERQSILYTTLINLLENSKLLKKDEELLALFNAVFEKYSAENENKRFVIKYFEFIKMSEGYKRMLQRAKDFLINIDLPDLKVFVCKSYFEIAIMDSSFEHQSSDVMPLIEDVLQLNENLDVTNFIKAGLYYHNLDFFNAHYIASNLYSINRENKILSILVAKCCLKLQRWIEAENVSRKLTLHSDEIVSKEAMKILLCALAYQNDKEKSLKAIEIKSKLETGCLGDMEYSALFCAYICTEMFSEAKECLEYLKNSERLQSLTANLLKKMGKPEEALQLLINNKEKYPSCWFELGLYYWEKKDYRSSLIPFLQTAKFDKYNYLVFLYLGEYNRLYDVNIEKSKKCYQKAFTLNPECTQAGKNLSYAYRYLQNWEANYELLKSVTSRNGPQDSWAWLSLGLHHLALEQWNEAIITLRTFVRFHPNDAEAWESLADAYYSRGSLSSSLKCYQRALDLDASRKYSLVQIGTVQCSLGQLNEALITYKSNDDDQYLPALIGMAEVKLCVANEKYSQNFYGCCRDSAQEAIELITVAILKENRFVCLWKILASAISIIARLPPKYRWLFIDSKFNNEEEIDKLTLLSEADVFVLAIRCLCKAIQLSTSFYSYLYHELAIVYLDYYRHCGNKNIANKSYAAIKKCLSAEQNVWQYWITLGVISMSKGIKKYAIAQHAFIQALNLDTTNSMIWSNLGLMHLCFDKTIVSNRLFQKAQQFDPTHLYNWIGQGLIAESVGHEDAMDLFRHSTELGFQKESSLGYAEWVTKTFMKSFDEKQYKLEYSIKNMHAVPMACDLMTWYNEYENEEACSLNIFGILLEKMGLLNKASVTFEKALKLVDQKYKDFVLVNYGRTLFRLEKYNMANEMFQSVSEATLDSACGLALSLYKCEKYQEAFAIYSTALQWLANDDKEKSELLVAMGSMAYKFQGIDDCKTLLFQSVQLNKDIPSIPGLLAIYSIGLLHSELALSNLVIAELHKLSNSKEYYKYIGFFESFILMKNEKPMEAIRLLVSHIHHYPDNMYLWQHLSKYCLTGPSHAALASKSAQTVILSRDPKENIQNYRVASVAEMYLENLKSSIKFAQMAIHMYPNDAKNWSLLLSVMLPKSPGSPDLTWYRNLLVYVKDHLNPNKAICNWLNFFERHFIVGF